MAKKNKDLIYYVAGFLLIFGVSGLIYELLLPYTFIIGSIATIIGFILTFIIVIRKKKKRKR